MEGAQFWIRAFCKSSCFAIQRVFCFLEIGAICLVIESNLNLLGRRSETDWII